MEANILASAFGHAARIKSGQESQNARWLPQCREMGFGQTSPGLIASELMEPLEETSCRKADLWTLDKGTSG